MIPNAFCRCSAGFRDAEDHGHLIEQSQRDLYRDHAPIKWYATIDSCSDWRRKWEIETSGDSHSTYSHFVRRL